MMAQPEPAIRCCDVWCKGLPDACREAYKALANRGEIEMIRITASKRQGMVVVEYKSNTPHDWTLEQLKSIRDKEDKP